ncbi:MAG: M23 family metallopeptidase [bacterium]
MKIKPFFIMVSGLALLAVSLTAMLSIAPAQKVNNSSTDDRKAAWSDIAKDSAAAETMTAPSAMSKIAALDMKEAKAALLSPATVELSGDLAQGGLVRGKTQAGAKITLDDRPVMVDQNGLFLLGFHRDHGPTATLTITLKDGTKETRILQIADREFNIERIDGLPPSQVDQYTKEQLAKIAEGRRKKDAARKISSKDAMWTSGFDWPVTGRISGRFGSQRILNGVEKRPHSGMDVAAPAGTPIKAPADGIIRLAETDMYFEGGLVFIDHGQNLESAIMHMSRVDVKPGQRVSKGDVIGAVGATGRATGPHMHWSLKWQNRLLDPQLVVAEAN